MLIKRKYNTNINESTSNGFKIEDGVLIKYREYTFDYRDVVIPNGVTKIGAYAFDGCKYIKSVNIPNSVTLIGPFAFCGCKNLISVNIPNSVKCIKYSAFSICESLESITIPNGVTKIGSYIFDGCKSLKEINMPIIIDCDPYDLIPLNITKFNGVDILSRDDLHFIELDNEKTLILPDEEFMNYELNGEECYIKYIESNYNKFIIAVYPDMKREVFDIHFNSLTDGVRLVDILDVYDKYPVGVREDGKQTFICWEDDDFLYKGQWFDECYTDTKGNMYIDGKKVN